MHTPKESVRWRGGSGDNEDVEPFACVGTHDFQEPLRMIMVYSQLLVKSIPASWIPTLAMFVYHCGGNAGHRGLAVPPRSLY